jgi:predicted Rossmann fold nucleotide-binding protein DprA/Smf involved in DNA uptake
MVELSPNTQAILLLTAPLITGADDTSYDLFTRAEYRKLEALLTKLNLQPADLLSQGVVELSREATVDLERIKRLLDRGFQLSQALENWQARALWIVSPADDSYPKRLRERLGNQTPSLLYGCGSTDILELGGLAVVGSRDVDSWLIQYTETIGALAAQSNVPIVSGGARGIDQAAMRGALEGGGRVIGVLSDSLQRAAMNRAHRDLLIDRQLVLISPFDPLAGFNVGHAMQRNKLIYALSDLALVVNSDVEKGGTWAGAVEQLDKLHLVPVYVRSTGEIGEGLEALGRKGAIPWPNPKTCEEFQSVLESNPVAPNATYSTQLSLL